MYSTPSTLSNGGGNKSWRNVHFWTSWQNVRWRNVRGGMSRILDQDGGGGVGGGGGRGVPIKVASRKYASRKGGGSEVSLAAQVRDWP